MILVWKFSWFCGLERYPTLVDLVTFLRNKYVTVEGVKIGSRIWKKVKWDLLNKPRMYIQYFVDLRKKCIFVHFYGVFTVYVYFDVLRVNIDGFESFSTTWGRFKVKKTQVPNKIRYWKFQINFVLIWKRWFRCQTWHIKFI